MWAQDQTSNVSVDESCLNSLLELHAESRRLVFYVDLPNSVIILASSSSSVRLSNKFSKMSKRRFTQEGVQYIGTPIASITEAQIAALLEARSALPLGLESLSPLLENILDAYGDVVPPHARPITVSV